MDDELDGPGVAERWSLDLDTLGWIEAKAGPRRLGLATQLRHYALTGRFAESAEAIPPAAARYLAEQTGRPVGDLDGYGWAGREPRSATARRSCAGSLSGPSSPRTSRRSRSGSRLRSVPAARPSRRRSPRPIGGVSRAATKRRARARCGGSPARRGGASRTPASPASPRVSRPRPSRRWRPRSPAPVRVRASPHSRPTPARSRSRACSVSPIGSPSSAGSGCPAARSRVSRRR